LTNPPQPETDDTPAAHAAWLGTSRASDAEETIEKIKALDQKPDWLVVDHYALDEQWEKRLRPFVQNIFVIDDLADRAHDCDLLLDQNLHQGLEQRYRGLLSPACTTLLGPKYALLRPEFRRDSDDLRDVRRQPRSIMVFMGGVDLGNESLRVVKNFIALDRTDISLSVIVGNDNPHYADMRAQFSSFPNISFHVNVSNMAERLDAADVAFGAGGVAMWERCCVGVPTITVSVAENQESGAQAVGAYGGTLYLGRSADVSDDTIRGALTLILNSESLRSSLSSHAASLVDGAGCARVIKHLISSGLHLRPANEDDSDAIFEWRNDEDVRRFSGDGKVLKFEDHQRWFANTLVNADRILLIGEDDGKPVGVLRYDLDQDVAKISIYLVPGNSGRGIGLSLLVAGEKWLTNAYPAIRYFHAEVCNDNIASMRLFETMNFTPHLTVFQKEVKAHV